MSARPAAPEPLPARRAALRLIRAEQDAQAEYQRRRRELLGRLADPRQRSAAARELDDAYLESRLSCSDDAADEQPVERLRRLIAASLEGGLLRQSRREQILAEARRLGIPEFHAHLLIAQVQVGPLSDPALEEALTPAAAPAGRRTTSASRVGLRLLAAGLLGATMFLAMVRYLSV